MYKLTNVIDRQGPSRKQLRQTSCGHRQLTVCNLFQEDPLQLHTKLLSASWQKTLVREIGEYILEISGVYQVTLKIKSSEKDLGFFSKLFSSNIENSKHFTGHTSLTGYNMNNYFIQIKPYKTYNVYLTPTWSVNWTSMGSFHSTETMDSVENVTDGKWEASIIWSLQLRWNHVQESQTTGPTLICKNLGKHKVLNKMKSQVLFWIV